MFFVLYYFIYYFIVFYIEYITLLIEIERNGSYLIQWNNIKQIVVHLLSPYETKETFRTT